MNKERFKGAGSFKVDLYTGMLKDSSEFFTKARNTGNRDKDILLTSSVESGFMMGIVGYFHFLW